MCTVAVAFYPQTKQPLIVGANRDENPTRPSKPWDLRDGIFSPLDIRGDVENGTWFGVNTRGMFCAITNWDFSNTEKEGNFKSRGIVVYNTLRCSTIFEATNYWKTLQADNYKPFNVLLGSCDSLFHLSCNGKTIHVGRLGAGLHWSTGAGFNVKTKRTEYIYQHLRSSVQHFSQPILAIDIQQILSKHNDGVGSEDSVCVHDESHEWETRSSSLVSMGVGRWNIKYKVMES